ncbi:hypothetical protein PILCRDRAFT_11914 [Piloderma croceum F 1598]|uniref:Uncharacterized protein n=1 Tax=Piloderma croceum (strain F 1598) TaxID=765440 RepID=A0A0C3EYR9_PILCF|nr:hypothetical protein PILCRDRAFT_11914 [Piloderma croceum F 1598]
MHNGYPYEWVIRGFRRFAPLFKEKKKEKGNAKAPPEDAECRGQIITMDTQTHIFINTYQEQGRHRPESQPWPDNLAYTYNSGFTRWMLVLPAAETTLCVVSKPSASTIKEGTVTLLLTGTGTPGLQPHNTAVPPATTIAGNAPTGDIPDENIDMEEPCDEEDPFHVMETDTT